MSELVEFLEDDRHFPAVNKNLRWQYSQKFLDIGGIFPLHKLPVQWFSFLSGTKKDNLCVSNAKLFCWLLAHAGEEVAGRLVKQQQHLQWPDSALNILQEAATNWNKWSKNYERGLCKPCLTTSVPVPEAPQQVLPVSEAPEELLPLPREAQGQPHLSLPSPAPVPAAAAPVGPPQAQPCGAVLRPFGDAILPDPLQCSTPSLAECFDDEPILGSAPMSAPVSAPVTAAELSGSVAPVRAYKHFRLAAPRSEKAPAAPPRSEKAPAAQLPRSESAPPAKDGGWSDQASTWSATVQGAGESARDVTPVQAPAKTPAAADVQDIPAPKLPSKTLEHLKDGLWAWARTMAKLRAMVMQLTMVPIDVPLFVDPPASFTNLYHPSSRMHKPVHARWNIYLSDVAVWASWVAEGCMNDPNYFWCPVEIFLFCPNLLATMKGFAPSRALEFAAKKTELSKLLSGDRSIYREKTNKHSPFSNKQFVSLGDVLLVPAKPFETLLNPAEPR